MATGRTRKGKLKKGYRLCKGGKVVKCKKRKRQKK